MMVNVTAFSNQPLIKSDLFPISFMFVIDVADQTRRMGPRVIRMLMVLSITKHTLLEIYKEKPEIVLDHQYIFIGISIFL